VRRRGTRHVIKSRRHCVTAVLEKLPRRWWHVPQDAPAECFVIRRQTTTLNIREPQPSGTSCARRVGVSSWT
jgi:hypothetical protein